jgi:hypothetical protein
VDSQGNHKYDCFIPEVPISGTSAPAQATDSASGDKRERQPKKPTAKGALYHEYNYSLHAWLAHLRRVHWQNPECDMGGGVMVKAANPLAPKGAPLYYFHSRTDYYNTFFFEFWEECFVKTFGLVCPFYEVQSVRDVEHILDAKFTRYVDAFGIILHNRQ